jgi:hypothetical protein
MSICHKIIIQPSGICLNNNQGKALDKLPEKQEQMFFLPTIFNHFYSQFVYSRIHFLYGIV